MVVLGEGNSRYKDFYDLHVLARQFRFDGKTLARAIAATFERRQTPITAAIPTSLTPRFFADEARAQQWRAYVTRNSLPAAPTDFASVGELICSLGPVWTAVAASTTSTTKWPPGGPWNSENSEKEIFTAMPASSGLPRYGQQHSQNSDTPRIEIPIATPLRRFKPYPAYKDSGVEWLGNVPAHWELKALKYFLRAPLAYGVLKPDRYSGEDGVNLIRILDIESGQVHEAALELISPEQSKEYRRTVVRAGDLVLSVVGTRPLLYSSPPFPGGGESIEGASASSVEAAARCSVPRVLLRFEFLRVLRGARARRNCPARAEPWGSG